jgi:hypothetical protein
LVIVTVSIFFVFIESFFGVSCAKMMAEEITAMEVINFFMSFNFFKKSRSLDFVTGVKK